MACAFVEAGDLGKVNRMGQFGAIKGRLHAIIEMLGPDHLIVVATILNGCRNMPGLRGPVDVGAHWLVEPEGVSRKKHKASGHLDLIEVAVYVDPEGL